MQRKKIIDVLISVMTVAAMVTGMGMLSNASYSPSTISLAQQPSTTLSPQEPQVLGTVAGITGNEITLARYIVVSGTTTKTASPDATIVAVVGKEVPIERITIKDPATITKERDAYVASIVKLQKDGSISTTTPPAPPTTYSIETLTLQDLKVGDALTVFTVEELSETAVITAKKIDVRPALASQR